MSLEYAIEYQCEMRREYGEQTLRALARTNSLISRIVNETIAIDGIPSEESVRFTSRFSEDLEKVERISSYCRKNCPVFIDGIFPDLKLSEPVIEPIDCLGRIHYPIEARFERFLADRLQLIFDTSDQQDWPHLMKILIDPESPFDGEVTKELRRITTDDGLRFYESRLPVSLTGRSHKLTTDNVFDILAGFIATDEGASGYQREIPVIALDDYGEFLEALLINEMTPDEIDRHVRNGTTYTQYLRFMRAIRTAERLGVRILID